MPKRKSQDLNIQEKGDSHLTEEAIEKLKSELDRLENRSRPKTVIELTAAREMGDLSENAAYTMAKGRLAGIDRRIFEINDLMKNAIIVKKGAGRDGSIKIGTTVTVEMNGRERILEITGSHETDPGSGKISSHSPVGGALMGHKAGETVCIKTGDGREISCCIKKTE